MSLDQTSEEEIRMEQELSEVSERLIQQIMGGIIGSVESINSSDGQSFIKLVEGKVERRLHSVVLSTLEDLIREIAKEVIDRAFKNILTRNPANEFRPLEQRRLLLKFKYKLPQPVWTGFPLKNIEVSLVDTLTGEIINSGPEASATVEIVLIKDDGDYDREFDFEGFNQNIISKGEGNKSLLNEAVLVHLKEGIGCAGEFKFTHSSKYMKNRRLRLGARMVDNIYRTKVREAVTESFDIKDRRNELYEKHEIPSLSDNVLRLKNISKRSAFYKRLKEHNIETVKRFLIKHFTNPENLREIAHTTISDERLKETVAHALKCRELDNRYTYCSNCTSQKIKAITLNVVGQLFGAYNEFQYVLVDKLYEDQKIEAHELVLSALEHWENAIPEDNFFPDFDSSIILNYAATSHGLESFGLQNDGACTMFDTFENDMSCNTFQGIASSNISDWSGNLADDIGNSGTDFMYGNSVLFD